MDPLNYLRDVLGEAVNQRQFAAHHAQLWRTGFNRKAYASSTNDIESESEKERIEREREERVSYAASQL